MQEEHENLVELTAFSTVTQADQAKMLLESNDIECFMVNDNTAMANPMYSAAFGGVGIMVLESRYEEACDVLEKAGMMFVPEDEDIPVSSNPFLHKWVLIALACLIGFYLLMIGLGALMSAQAS